jgi:hypothetical protein
MIAQHAMLAHHRMGVRKEMVADANAGIKHHVGQQGRMRADLYAWFNHDVCADVGVWTNFGGRIDHGCRVNAFRICWRLVEHPERLGERVIWILDPERCRRDVGKLWLNDDGSRLCRLRQPRIARVGDKGDFGWSSVFNSFDASHFYVCIAAQFRA